MEIIVLFFLFFLLLFKFREEQKSFEGKRPSLPRPLVESQSFAIVHFEVQKIYHKIL